MGQPVGGHDDRRSGVAQDLDHEQTERPAAIDPGAPAAGDRPEAKRVQRDAERFEQGRFVVPDGIGQWVEQPARAMPSAIGARHRSG